MSEPHQSISACVDCGHGVHPPQCGRRVLKHAFPDGTGASWLGKCGCTSQRGAKYILDESTLVDLAGPVDR